MSKCIKLGRKELGLQGGGAFLVTLSVVGLTWLQGETDLVGSMEEIPVRLGGIVERSKDFGWNDGLCILYVPLGDCLSIYSCHTRLLLGQVWLVSSPKSPSQCNQTKHGDCRPLAESFQLVHFVLWE